MQALPSGTVTFLFTDIESSARLIEQHPDSMEEAQTRHSALLKSAIDAHRGYVFQVVGDAFCSVLENPGDAASAALDAQRAIHRESWGKIGAMRVRMGLHTGNAEARGGDYLSSLSVVRAQRVAAAGHGGQALLSSAAAEKLRPSLPTGTTLRDLGAHKLRGLADAEISTSSSLPTCRPTFHLARRRRGRSFRSPVGAARARPARRSRHRAAAAQSALGPGTAGARASRAALGRAGRGQVAACAGPDRTRAKSRCDDFAWRLLRVRSDHASSPFVEALRDWARRQSAEQLRTALGATAAEIAKFAPEIEIKLGALAPNAPLSPSEERLRMFDNAARLLRALAAKRGLLVFVDDLHWADQGTLSFLHYLLRHLRGDRVLLLGAYREIELDRAHPLAPALVEWNRERLSTRVALGRLSLADTGALLATLFGQTSVADDFAMALYRETEGNPFFIEEVVKSLIEQGQTSRDR